jgi:uncharacterized protein
MPQTPRQTVERLLDALVSMDHNKIADFYAEDVVIEMPFHDQPLEPGREALRARMAGAAGIWQFDGVDDVRIHETADPEVVIAECAIHGRAAKLDRDVSLRYVMIIRVRDGLVVHSRDYADNARINALMAELTAPNAG